MLSEEDEGRHPAGSGKLWSETYYFNFYDSQAEIGGFFWIQQQENRGKSNSFALMFRGGRPVYYAVLHDQSYSRNGLDQGVTVGGLTFQLVEPLKTIKIEMQDPDREIKLDLIWRAIHPPAHIGMIGEALPDSLAQNHYEQGGRVSGNIMLRGESLSLKGCGFRDHSWGIRDWESIERHELAWFVLEGDRAVACGRADMADGRSVHAGFLYDGVDNLAIGQMDLEVGYEENALTQMSVAIRLTDEKGRQAEITGRRLINFAVPFAGFLLNEAMFEYRDTNGKLGYGVCETGHRL